MARPYFWKYVDAQTYPGVSGISGAQATMAMAAQWDNTIMQNPRMRALHKQVSSGQEYDKELYEQLIAPITYDIWATNPYGKKQISEWHQSDLAEEKKKHDQALQQQQQEIQKIKDQQAEVDRKRQEAAAAAEKSRKEQEFKSALDAMNQRTMKRSVVEEDLGAVAVDPEEAAKKKKKKVSYESTKTTAVLGIPQAGAAKQLLGM